ncbi:MAG: CcoQ/FixQ family Cbb3-type cytochrome c oxidase assembly chaperone [Xanthomonadales bacterium]|nr:CcoQ/FixQ family Cbb3-type cytochrome c oxidase assembly chaperone [Xanthomonadales bacterium]NIN60282.1 CcoQ/FixQ family Cbb3-type cytochrome c oxidase assembly chaperone [Xanthomonadales bacterium]NIN75634.1 CcoQ/FixQ family Cbb3-type cytochrome c oxidase assembly chaperone [Xanthomonadales bacterium]NIO14707.1 CcoQ/FixQ family Cbb3-type cytochrome c oxidase assembly chaperone [Xanthomonadales bacterium]NIP12675.1 CcoQ/FixQ family Cbb3-type cytochrome c oxidase assembly chaperone [Xanthomo
MTYLLFAGDMLVMAFMMIVVVWVSLKSSKKTIDEASRIPLEDEQNHG